MDRIHLTSTVAVLSAAVLVTSGCSTGYAALGTHTATVLINGVEIGERLPVRCEQVEWTWRIETLESAPGFVAQIQTGDSIIARGVQIEELGGFTGSYWAGTVGQADADISDGTFRITGSAEGYYHHDPSEDATADFVIRTDC